MDETMDENKMADSNQETNPFLDLKNALITALTEPRVIEALTKTFTEALENILNINTTSDIQIVEKTREENEETKEDNINNKHTCTDNYKPRDHDAEDGPTDSTHIDKLDLLQSRPIIFNM